MRIKGLLIALGVGALVVFVLATLPASLVTGRLERYGVRVQSVAGTVWSGDARGLELNGVAIGDLRWALRPATLLGGRLAGVANLHRGDGAVQATFEQSFSGRTRLTSARGDLPLETLRQLQLGIPRGWTGRVVANIDELVLDDRWPIVARGTLDIDTLAAPPPRAAAYGSYRLSFAGDQRDTDRLAGTLVEKDGPLSVRGALRFGRDRSFTLEGTVAPRGVASADVERTLRMLGPPDASGRRPFSVTGTF